MALSAGGTPQRIDVAQVLIERDGKVLVVHTLSPDSSIDRWGLHGTHDLFAVFRGRADGDPHPQAGDVVVACRWISLDEADALMPWYPGGVRALLAGCVGYYIDRSSV